MITSSRAACVVLLTFLLVAVSSTAHGADDPPPGTPGFVAGDDAYQVDKGSTLLALGSINGVIDNDALGSSPCQLAGCVVAVEDQPAHGTLSTSNFGGFTYVPDPAFSGTDTFTYRSTVSWGAYSNLATVTITVTESPETPGFVANDDTYDVPRDKARRIYDFASGPLRNDTVNGAPCTAKLCAYVVKSLPSHGRIVPDPGGITYIPDPGFVGTDTVTYRFAGPSSPSRSNTATITFHVREPRPVPSASPDTYATDEGVRLSVSAADGVLDNDVNATGLSIVRDVSHGELDLDWTTGAFRYDPEPGFVGSDFFTYQALNPDGASATTMVTITVSPAVPEANGDSYELDEDGSLRVDAPGVLGNDVGATTASLVTDAEHGALVLNADGSFSYVPRKGYAGTDTFTYVGTDEPSSANRQAAAVSEPATVTLTINAKKTPIDDPPADDDPPVDDVDDRGGTLPDTGASVHVATLVGALMAVLAGVVLVARPRRRRL